MTRTIDFIERLYNSIRYNGFYILLALLFPFIIWKLDAGREIILSMTDKGFGLNIGLSILTFSALCLSVWCIPTLAINIFQFIFDRRITDGAQTNPQNAKLKNCLFFQLINIYNGKSPSSKECSPGAEKSSARLPIRYFAIAPWSLFIITCLKVFVNNTTMIGGLLLIILVIVLADWKKDRIVGFFKRILLIKNKESFSKKNFILRYSFLTAIYYVVIFILIMWLHPEDDIELMKWLLCILNFLFLIVFYGFLLYMENSNLDKIEDTDPKSDINLPFRISNINYSSLIFYLVAAIITFYYLNQYQRIGHVSPVVVIVTMSTALIVFFELFFTSQFLLVRIVSRPACGNARCSLIACHSPTDDRKVTGLKAYRFALIAVLIIIANLYFFSSTNSHRIRVTEVQKEEYVMDSVRPTLTTYFRRWFDKRRLSDEDTVVYLISGQGGGSRAAAWFYMNMTNLSNSDPCFFDKVFSISTVSGSSSGANMFLAARYFNESVADYDIKNKAAALYGTNYMSSAFYGLMFGDFVESIFDVGKDFPRDRNYHLQKEELDAFNEVFDRKDGDKFFERDFMSAYLDTTKSHWPLFFINTTIVNFGTRAFFSPVSMDSVSVARDLYGEFKNNACNARENLPMITCVNQSQAFPILSAYNYLECIGRLGDGGFSENSGCATTLEIYRKLRHYCNTKKINVRFICLNITNGELDSNFKVSFKKASIFNTLTAAMNSPFDGSETYAYRNLEGQVKYLQNYNNNDSALRNRDTVINLSLDTVVTLTRTLSKQSVEFMYTKMPPAQSILQK